jgi:hypothetical protein
LATARKLLQVVANSPIVAWLPIEDALPNTRFYVAVCFGSFDDAQIVPSALTILPGTQ